MLITIVLIFLGVIVVSMIAINSTEKKAAENSIARMTKINEIIESNNLEETTKMYALCNFNIIVVDDKSKVLLLIKSLNANELNQKIKYADILDFELEIDNQKVISGKTGAAVAGGLLFGAAGAVVGASGERAINTTSTAVVRVYINNIQNPQIVLPFGSFINDAKELIAVLNVIANQQNSSEVTT